MTKHTSEEMSSFVVTDTSDNKSTHYEPLGGGRVALLPPAGNYIKPTLGDFVSHQKTAPMNYQVYQLSGTVTYDALAAGNVYLNPGPLNNLDYDQTVSVVSAFATTDVQWNAGPNYAPAVYLSADFPYITNYDDSDNYRDILTFTGTLLEKAAGGHGRLDGNTIAELTYGPSGGIVTAARVVLPAQPRLFMRYVANGGATPATGAAISFVINLIVVPGAPRATDIS
jgi:hypothetical protein